MTTIPRLPRLLAVIPEEAGVLRLTWDGGRTGRVDLSDWIARGGAAFDTLQDEAVFATARVEDYGTCVQWGDTEDLAIDAYHLGLLAQEQASPPSPDLGGCQPRSRFSGPDGVESFRPGPNGGSPSVP